MYHDHWGLRLGPFQGRAGPESFYPGSVHEEALARLRFLIEGRRRLGLLLGAAGSGKSLLLSVLADELRREGRPAAQMNLIGVTPDEWPLLLCDALRLSPRTGDRPAVLWRAIVDRIIENRYAQRGTTILLDDADAADEGVLRLVERLVQADPTPEAHLTIVLAAEEAGAARLGARLLGQSELRIELVPWEKEETAEYFDAALLRAGRNTPVFEPEALARLHDLTGGIPGRVERLADLALIAGAGVGLEQIDVSTVNTAHAELYAGLPSPASA